MVAKKPKRVILGEGWPIMISSEMIDSVCDWINDGCPGPRREDGKG